MFIIVAMSLYLLKESEKEFDKLNKEISRQETVIEKQGLKIKEQEKMIIDLDSRNDSLKKEIKSYKDKSESPSVSRGEGKHSQEIVFEATKYVAMCDTGCTGITATGVDVRNRTKVDNMKVIAVDPDVIPLYSIVKVRTENTSFYAIALDTGGSIDGFEIDILASSVSKAREFGRQKVSVTVLREGKEG